jgi:tRNA (guanine37-N1)-methyltransferase
MRIDVLTLFPEALEPFLASSIVGRAVEAGLVKIVCTNFRDFTADKHRSVDDKPFGGGAGMVLMPGPIFAAVEHAEAQAARHGASADSSATVEQGATGSLPARVTRVLLTPQGRLFDQRLARELATKDRLLLICGHYEGFDERVRTGLKPLEISIGDYVLSGGEPAAMVLIDAVVRLLPGAVGGEQTLDEESFNEGLLEYPQYTRPRDFRGMLVPEVLVSGHHKNVAQWRRAEALKRTWQRRPDLIRTRPELLEELRRVLRDEGWNETDLPAAPEAPPENMDKADRTETLDPYTTS